MKNQKILLLLAGIVLLASATAARADVDDRQVWRDTEGEIVHNTWGNCVRSRWILDYDPCGAPQPEKITLRPEPHTIIAQEARTIYFAFDKAELSPEAMTKLNTLADQLSTADDITGAKIVGYADRIGTVSYNEALSKKRATTVREYLISRNFIKPSVTETRWVGKSEPTAQCPAKMYRQELLQCLQPDRKVQVDIVYRETKTPE